MKPVQFHNRIQKLLKLHPALSGMLHQIDVGDVLKIPTGKPCFLIVVSGRIEIHLPAPSSFMLPSEQVFEALMTTSKS